MPAYTGGAGTSSATVGPTGPATSSGGPSTTSSRATGTSAAPTSGAFPDAIPTVTEGKSTVTTSAAPLKKAVLDYQAALAEALHTGQVPKNLGAVASGDLAGQVISSVEDWKAKGWSLRGGLVVSMLTAQTTGSSSTVSGCVQDSTAAFKGGAPVSTPKTTYYAYSGTLALRGTTWVLTALINQPRARCAV